MARRRLTLLAVLSAAFWSQLWAQSQQPMLRGRVLDPTRAPMSGAQVTVMQEGTASERTTVSDQNGEFSLSLDAGKYALKISKERFAESGQSVEISSAGFDLHEIILQ